MGRRASLAARRSTITHMAAICNKPSFQSLLPQLVLVGESQVTEAKLAALRANSPACGHVWRVQSGWMTAAIMVKYVRLLGQALKDFRTSHRFILFMDALRAHLNKAVLRAASIANLWICVIPGKLTWALQPCDTHLFACYKRQLGEEVQRRSGMTTSGEVNWEIVMESMWQVVTTLMNAKDWRRSFSSVGIADEQRNVSERTMRKLQIEPTAMEVRRGLPTLSDLTLIFPKGSVVPVHELFLGVERFCRGGSAGEVHGAADALVDENEFPAPVRNPWFGRTRSTSALASGPPAPSPPPPAQPGPT